VATNFLQPIKVTRMFCIMRIIDSKISYFVGYHYRDETMREVWDSGKLTIYDSKQEAIDVKNQLLDTSRYDRLSIETITIGL